MKTSPAELFAIADVYNNISTYGPQPRIIFPAAFRPGILTSGAQIAVINNTAEIELRLIASQAKEALLKTKLSPQKHRAENLFIYTFDEEVDQYPAGKYDIEINPPQQEIYRFPNVFIKFPAKKAAKFVVFSDLHLGDYRIRFYGPLLSNTRQARRLIQQMNEQKPDFGILCGDLSGSIFAFKLTYKRAEQILGKETPFQIFSTPGNHDGHSLVINNKCWIDGFNYWRKCFGPTYYSFDYADLHLVAINSYDWTLKERNLMDWKSIFHWKFNQAGSISPSQLTWLEEDLKQAREKKQTIIFFMHHNPLHRYFYRPNGKKYPGGWSGAGQETLLALLKQYKPALIFVGHQHYDHIEDWENIPFITTTSSGSIYEPGHPWGYRLVISNNEGIKIEGSLNPIASIPLKKRKKKF